ncbi:MAG: Hsp20/alpha crystallin family protein [Candidatus Limnocylindrales bacterium]
MTLIRRPSPFGELLSVVEAALAGVKPEDVDDDGYSYREISRGSFSRAVSLPSGLRADDATATFENGLLRLSIPQADETKPRQIQITPNAVSPTAVDLTVVESATPSEASDEPTDDTQAENFLADEMPAETQPLNQWQSTNQPSSDEWQTGSQTADQWQSNGQGQSNEPVRVEQGS